ncbi:hypothetical protein GCM10009786_05050 [Leucobacter alluvii]|uniref:Uncharacterized protein n=1 Tax=Leucobacter alluvii TaxID=340321 RepID=A0ABP5MUF6_9MICO
MVRGSAAELFNGKRVAVSSAPTQTNEEAAETIRFQERFVSNPEWEVSSATVEKPVNGVSLVLIFQAGSGVM